jgi:hypothetical protein
MSLMSARSVNRLLEEIGKALGALPGVFSTVQWGGRAYKLPGPGGNRNKPKLLAHVWMTKAGDAVGVDFKLAKERAVEVVDQHDWIRPHSFRTLAPSGWVSAKIRTAKQAASLKRLLGESRSLYGKTAEPDPVPARDDPGAGASPGASPIARKIDAVMRQAAAEGWKPRGMDDFDATSSRARTGGRSNRGPHAKARSRKG